MSYIINNSRGNIVAIVPDGVINTANTSLALIGQSVTNYGTSQNENFVYLLENFAKSSPPLNPTLGQLWYNSSTDVISTYNSANAWVTLSSKDYVDASINSSKISPAFSGIPTAPTATAGTTNNQIATTEFVNITISNFSGTISNAQLAGNSTAITAAYGTNTTQIATTEFVQSAFSGGPAGNTVISGNLSLSGSLSVANNSSTTGNVVGGNILTIGVVSATGDITGSNLNASANVYAVNYIGNTVSVTGNIVGGNVLGGSNVNATLLTGTTLSVSGTVYAANVFSATHTGTSVSVSGNVNGNNVFANNIYATNVFVSGTTPFRLPSLTQAQIDALTPQNGDMVYNTTLNLPQIFQVSAWKNFTISYYS